MKNSINSGTALTAQNESFVGLEPISMVELVEVLGGNNENTTDDKKEEIKDKGHAGGLVCWC